jgi:glycosyltransferase involved in cell wall biosynthesis
MQEADVVVDQLIGGSFGYFAVEGMAFGKPVVCYIKDPSRVADPASFPIINADSRYDLRHPAQPALRPDELGGNRPALAQYVERYQSVGAFAARLRSLYLEPLHSRRRCSIP